ncbi:uncharacterized protein MONOS_18513 [Monocercomonoides exilis]|uniref:uncharacterized protein n=1 Tax=Monocercomonoides exilis TaxID=2049356 RepID=UPI00355A691C|nr:hypothetical protein MONOS_18513 [Monocercomonoides exilis]
MVLNKNEANEKGEEDENAPMPLNREGEEEEGNGEEGKEEGRMNEGEAEEEGNENEEGEGEEGEEEGKGEDEEPEEEYITVMKTVKRQRLLHKNPPREPTPFNELKERWSKMVDVFKTDKEIEKEQAEQKKRKEKQREDLRLMIALAERRQQAAPSAVLERRIGRLQKQLRKLEREMKREATDDSKEEVNEMASYFTRRSEEGEREAEEGEMQVNGHWTEAELNAVETEEEKADWEKRLVSVEFVNHIPPTDNSLDESAVLDSLSEVARTHLGGLQVHPFYRHFCPVHWALHRHDKRGGGERGGGIEHPKLVRGSLQNAVGYRGYIFLLSSRRRARLFVANPRRFLRVGPPLPEDCPDEPVEKGKDGNADEEEEDEDINATDGNGSSGLEANDDEEEEEEEEEGAENEREEGMAGGEGEMNEGENEGADGAEGADGTANLSNSSPISKKKEKEAVPLPPVSIPLSKTPVEKSGLRVIVVGPPLSGKSTVAHVLSRVLNLRVIDVEDLPPTASKQIALDEAKEIVSGGSISADTLAAHIAESCRAADPTPDDEEGEGEGDKSVEEEKKKLTGKEQKEKQTEMHLTALYTPPDPYALAAKAAEAAKATASALLFEVTAASQKGKKGKKGSEKEKSGASGSKNDGDKKGKKKEDSKTAGKKSTKDEKKGKGSNQKGKKDTSNSDATVEGESGADAEIEPMPYAASLPFAKGDYRGWVLDGFPATKEQAAALLRCGVQPDVVVVLGASDTDEAPAEAVQEIQLSLRAARVVEAVRKEGMGRRGSFEGERGDEDEWSEEMGVHPAIVGRMGLFKKESAKVLHLLSKDDAEYANAAEDDENEEENEEREGEGEGEDGDGDEADNDNTDQNRTTSKKKSKGKLLPIPDCFARIVKVPYTLPMHLSHGRVLQSVCPVFPRAERMESYDDVLPTQRVFGWSRHFCPVTFKEENALVVGDSQFCCIYRSHVYLFAGAEQQARFMDAPFYYAEGGPGCVPPLRCVVVGSHGAGKTTAAEMIAKQCGVRVIGRKEVMMWKKEEEMQQKRAAELAAAGMKAENLAKKEARLAKKEYKRVEEERKKEAAEAARLASGSKAGLSEKDRKKKKPKVDYEKEEDEEKEKDAEEEGAEEEEEEGRDENDENNFDMEEGEEGEERTAEEEGEEAEADIPVFPLLISRLKALKGCC